jgi:DNA mismatch repair protein MutL
MLIDQKRAHERILYEKFIESLSRHTPVSQIECFPVLIEIEAAESQAFSGKLKGI